MDQVCEIIAIGYRIVVMVARNIDRNIDTPLCTGMALKGGYPRVWPERGRSCWRKGVGALAYDKDLDGNMH